MKEDLVSFVQEAINAADLGQSKLPKEVLGIEGMSSSKVRHLLNNLCSLPGSAYLEIGVWKGSTWVSALYGNATNLIDAVAIENWSDFGGPFKEFLNNQTRFLPDYTGRLYSLDAFQVPKQEIFNTPINVYFYDGYHSEESQKLAFTYYNDVFDDVFVAVVDDWNHYETPVGTRAAFRDLGYTVLFDVVLPASRNGDTSAWWNGLYVAVIRK